MFMTILPVYAARDMNRIAAGSSEIGNSVISCGSSSPRSNIADHFGHYLPMQIGFLHSKPVDIDDEVGDVFAQPFQIQFAVTIDIRPCQVSTKRPNGARHFMLCVMNRPVRELITMSTPFPPVDFHHLVVEVERTRIEDMFDAHLPHVFAFFFCSRRGNHLCAGALRQPDRRAADSASSGMNQHGVAAGRSSPDDTTSTKPLCKQEALRRPVEASDAVVGVRRNGRAS